MRSCPLGISVLINVLVLSVSNTKNTLKYCHVCFYRVYKIETFLNRTECDGLTGVHMRLVNQLSTVPALVCYDGLDIFRQHLQLVRDDPVRVSSSDFIEGMRYICQYIELIMGLLQDSLSFLHCMTARYIN